VSVAFESYVIAAVVSGVVAVPDVGGVALPLGLCEPSSVKLAVPEVKEPVYVPAVVPR